MQISVQTSDRLVVQFGTSLGERDGCEVVTLDESQEKDLRAALSQPNGGVTFDGKAFAGLPYVPPPEPEPIPDPAAEAIASFVAAVQAAADLDGVKAAAQALASRYEEVKTAQDSTFVMPTAKDTPPGPMPVVRAGGRRGGVGG